MLKILGGQAKGRALKARPQDLRVRPILARVKKSLFDIIRPRLTGARFLDLYAGTGAVGLEALSRGVSFCAFVELSSESFKMLNANLAQLGFTDKAQTFRMNVLGDLALLPKPFDIIFMGPPYKDESKKSLALVSPTLENVDRHQLLAPRGLVIAQHHKKETVALPSAGWRLFRTETYGDTILSFIQKA